MVRARRVPGQNPRSSHHPDRREPQKNANTRPVCERSTIYQRDLRRRTLRSLFHSARQHLARRKVGGRKPVTPQRPDPHEPQHHQQISHYHFFHSLIVGLATRRLQPTRLTGTLQLGNLLNSKQAATSCARPHWPPTPRRCVTRSGAERRSWMPRSASLPSRGTTPPA